MAGFGHTLRYYRALEILLCHWNVDKLIHSHTNID